MQHDKFFRVMKIMLGHRENPLMRRPLLSPVRLAVPKFPDEHRGVGDLQSQQATTRLHRHLEDAVFTAQSTTALGSYQTIANPKNASTDLTMADLVKRYDKASAEIAESRSRLIATFWDIRRRFQCVRVDRLAEAVRPDGYTVAVLDELPEPFRENDNPQSAPDRPWFMGFSKTLVVYALDGVIWDFLGFE